MNKNTLIYFISGKGSSHEIKEVKMLSGLFSVAIIGCPQNKEHLYKTNNVTFIKKQLNFSSLLYKIITYISILPIWVLDAFQNISNIEYQKRWRLHISLLAQQKQLANQLKNNPTIKQYASNIETFWGSYWFNESTLVLSFLKKAGIINHFFCRAHGRDLYEEREPKTRKLPFRNFVLKHINAVHCISKHGMEYLSKRYPNYKRKFHCHYLGTEDMGLGVFNPTKQLTIVSCANYRNIKRLYLIPENLKNLNIPIHWIHIGAMNEKDPTFSRFQNALEEIKTNDLIDITFKGLMSQEEIYSFLKKHHIDLFVSVSETEGLPISMMEAQSFGIPILSTDVGGCSEIVNKETGFLLDKNFQYAQLCNYLELIHSQKNFFDREIIRKHWKDNFHDTNNYDSFYKQILKSIKTIS